MSMTENDFKKIDNLMKAAIKEAIEPITQRLDNVEFGLTTLNTKVDNITHELFYIHKLTETTYDLLKLEIQQRKDDTKEIREYVGLPTKEY